MTPPDPSPATPVDTSAEAAARMVDGLRGANEPASILLAAVVKERDDARAAQIVAQGEREDARREYGSLMQSFQRQHQALVDAQRGHVSAGDRADTASRQLAEARATVAQFEKLMAEIAETVGKTTWFGDLAQLVKATLFEARESGRLAGRAEAAATLREHWLTGVHCDHEAKTDVATCYCSVWRSEPQASVGAAVECWIEHVQAILSASTTPDPCPTCGGKRKIFTDGDPPFIEPGVWRDCPQCASPHRDPGGAHGG